MVALAPQSQLRTIDIWLLPTLEQKQERSVPHLSLFVLRDEVAVEVL